MNSFAVDSKAWNWLKGYVAVMENYENLPQFENHPNRMVARFAVNRARVMQDISRLAAAKERECALIYSTLCDPARDVCNGAMTRNHTVPISGEKVMFAIPTVDGNINCELFRRWDAIRSYANYCGFNIFLAIFRLGDEHSEKFIDNIRAMNRSIRSQFLESDCDWLICCDDNVVPPENIIRLLDRAHPIACATDIRHRESGMEMPVFSTDCFSVHKEAMAKLPGLFPGSLQGVDVELYRNTDLVYGGSTGVARPQA